jgi:hypothetical protein
MSSNWAGWDPMKTAFYDPYTFLSQHGVTFTANESAKE